MSKALEQARAMLEEVTPLTKNCGSLCGNGCCLPKGDGENGMLLFPGEEEYYSQADWYEIKNIPQGKVLICQGSCPRENRPLACRIFPLTPVLRKNGELKIKMDIRAREVCPLVPHGKKGLQQLFVNQVQGAMEALMEEKDHKEHIEQIAWEVRAQEDFWKNFLG